MRSKLSGVQIPTAAKLNIDGEFTLDASAGTSGQLLISQGSGNTPVWTSSPNLLNPLLTSISTVGGGGSEGGQINFARTTDGTAYWYIDTFGSTSTPDLRVIENVTERFRFVSGGALSVNGQTGTSGQVLTSAGGSAPPTWTTPSSSFTGGTLTSSLTLRSGTATAGTAPLYFGTSSPALLTTAVPGAIEYDGIAHYATPENNAGTATSGRALITTPHMYLTTATSPDFSTATTAQTLLGDGVGTNTTRGLTVLAGYTYEFEYYFQVRYQSFGDTTTSISVGWTRTTISGTPTTTITSLIEYGSNTTSFATAQSLTQLNGTATTTVSHTSPGASGSRYITYRAKGIVRVTGTGSVKIYPSISTSATTANVPTISADGYFKMTPIGNGTVTSIGAWA